MAVTTGLVGGARTPSVEGMSDANRTGQRKRRVGIGMAVGVIIGAGLGLGVGAFFFENAFLGVAFGIGIGVAVGVALSYGDAHRPIDEAEEPPLDPVVPDRSDAGMADAGLTELIEEQPPESVAPPEPVAPAEPAVPARRASGHG